MISILSDRTTQGSQDAGRLVLRLAVAIVLLFHGVAKLKNGVAWIADPLADLGLPAFISYGAYLGEVVAPLLMIVGYKVRLAALVIVGNMSMVLLLAHRKDVFAINEGGGGWAVELQALILFGALAVFLLGSERFVIGGSRSS
ncbi:MAG: hypothetical protein MNPFHGCM_00416 [Gemmatimonadaceae bacterium]|nr:hypothetical protein [Gemmatimonadaceae bacterium]